MGGATMLKFEGSWEKLVVSIKEAIQKNETLEIALPPEEFKRLKDLNGNFFCGKGIGEQDLPKNIANRLFLISGSGGKPPMLLVGRSVT
jgi:hypothetical protein